MKNSKQPRYEKKVSPAANGYAVLAMVLVSGFAGLAYQILWMQQLGLLFGNTAHAASATLATFFAGLGAGSWWWGKRVGASPQPLRLYAGLEVGIAISALIYFVVMKAFQIIYPAAYAQLGGSEWMLALKFLMTFFLIFPAAFFMGGTVPVIGQVMIRERSRFGSVASLLYAINTLGAALGVLVTVFVLVPAHGYRITCALAILLSLGVALLAWRLSHRQPGASAPTAKPAEFPMAHEPAQAMTRLEKFALAGLCFLSGFVVLALEVVWTRVFAQVHENSVYSFAITLVVVLVGLALGAGLSSILSQFSRRPLQTLAVLTALGGGLLLIGPSLLMHVTHDLAPLSAIISWSDHVRGLFKMGFGGIGYAVIVLGSVFPFLMKVAERDAGIPGRTLGRLLAINTAGAIIGSLVCGFLLLPHLGMWGTMRTLTAIYLIVALLLPSGWGRVGISCRIAAGGFLALLFTVLDPTDLPVINTSAGKSPIKVLQAWESSECTVTVVESQDGNRSIKVNSGYSLGSTNDYQSQTNQSNIPLYLFPQTRSICYIGLGTGMSAGAALNARFPNVDRIITCELLPAVAEAAEKWMPPVMTGGVFNNPRSTILIEDGRHYLMASKDHFDMINADLFLPYQRGAGSLYSLDHYQAVAKRLKPDGVFVQWIPLYQVTRYEFGVIAKTMMQAFDQVTMWRNDFRPGQEKVALIGQKKTTPIPIPPSGNSAEMLEAIQGLNWWDITPSMVKAETETTPFLYAGNLTAARTLFEQYPINTDDKPVIEFQTPKLFRKMPENDKVIWCVGPKLISLIDEIFAAAPMDEDPIWASHPSSSKQFVSAGRAFHQAMVSKALGNREATDKAWADFLHHWKSAALNEP